ncbi:hypothetical protein PPERSA_12023 [Pseudocohnilembus persalinus]|uniref:Arf3-interacting protein 1 N-terminal domain-containing protein n=1 Tax=Pseudocohnilembus persalinus TaxID=266149 RepID=A0A0V0R8U9_PSEPJ|nr:hypothetical protein PPERSA_12023 [Pseudocohnilembus persalinus]|eukprot:KRX10899.1 hypothetical protein PPERSA_12023 [Pseudocohnilembus persalinus]
MITKAFAGEFDLLKGCIVKSYISDSHSFNENILSAYLLPDGVHKYEYDICQFRYKFLHQKVFEQISNINNFKICKFKQKNQMGKKDNNDEKNLNINDKEDSQQLEQEKQQQIDIQQNQEIRNDIVSINDDNDNDNQMVILEFLEGQWNQKIGNYNEILIQNQSSLDLQIKGIKSTQIEVQILLINTIDIDDMGNILISCNNDKNKIKIQFLNLEQQKIQEFFYKLKDLIQFINLLKSQNKLYEEHQIFTLIKNTKNKNFKRGLLTRSLAISSSKIEIMHYLQPVIKEYLIQYSYLPIDNQQETLLKLQNILRNMVYSCNQFLEQIPLKLLQLSPFKMQYKKLNFNDIKQDQENQGSLKIKYEILQNQQQFKEKTDQENSDAQDQNNLVNENQQQNNNLEYIQKETQNDQNLIVQKNDCKIENEKQNEQIVKNTIDKPAINEEISLLQMQNENKNGDFLQDNKEFSNQQKQEKILEINIKENNIINGFLDNNNFSQQVSLIDLILTFKEKTMLIYNGILMGKKVLFLGHDRPISDCIKFTATCYQMMKPFNIKDIIYPYSHLLDLQFIKEKCYLSAVSNPIFANQENWYDIFADINTGKVTKKRMNVQTQNNNNNNNNSNAATNQSNQNQNGNQKQKNRDDLMEEKMDQQDQYDNFNENQNHSSINLNIDPIQNHESETFTIVQNKQQNENYNPPSIEKQSQNASSIYQNMNNNQVNEMSNNHKNKSQNQNKVSSSKRKVSFSSNNSHFTSILNSTFSLHKLDLKIQDFSQFKHFLEKIQIEEEFKGKIENKNLPDSLIPVFQFLDKKLVNAGYKKEEDNIEGIDKAIKIVVYNLTEDEIQDLQQQDKNQDFKDVLQFYNLKNLKTNSESNIDEQENQNGYEKIEEKEESDDSEQKKNQENHIENQQQILQIQKSKSSDQIEQQYFPIDNEFQRQLQEQDQNIEKIIINSKIKENQCTEMNIKNENENQDQDQELQYDQYNYNNIESQQSHEDKENQGHKIENMQQKFYNKEEYSQEIKNKIANFKSAHFFDAQSSHSSIYKRQKLTLGQFLDNIFKWAIEYLKNLQVAKEKNGEAVKECKKKCQIRSFRKSQKQGKWMSKYEKQRLYFQELYNQYQNREKYEEYIQENFIVPIKTQIPTEEQQVEFFFQLKLLIERLEEMYGSWNINVLKAIKMAQLDENQAIQILEQHRYQQFIEQKQEILKQEQQLQEQQQQRQYIQQENYIVC